MSFASSSEMRIVFANRTQSRKYFRYAVTHMGLISRGTDILAIFPEFALTRNTSDGEPHKEIRGPAGMMQMGISY